MNKDNLQGYYWQGEKIRLRTMRDTDVNAKWEEYFDSKARQLLENGIELPVKSKEAYEELFKKPRGSEIIDLYIETLSGEFIGWINIHSMDRKNGTFSCGGSIFKNYRGKGYAIEAIGMVLRYCFHEMRFEKCNTECLSINEESINLHKKLGFIEEGRRRKTVYTDGKYQDIVLFGLTREEFDEYWQGNNG
jgi:RimJ/RimL family protein N-acetyltransferase